jgi:hypothetical protein
MSRYKEVRRADMSRYKQMIDAGMNRYVQVRADKSRYNKSRHECPISKLLLNEKLLCTVLPFTFFSLLMHVWR